MTVAERVYKRLTPYHGVDAENGLALQKLTGGLVAPLETCDIARDTDTHIAWGTVLDPDSVDARLLPWLALFTGDRLLPEETTQQQRDRLKDPNNFLRGTVDAIKAEVAPTLTGAKTVLVIERTSTPWTLTVVVRTSECPSPMLSERAARRQKAVGLLLSWAVTDEPIIDEGTRTTNAATGDIDTATIPEVT